MNGEQVLRLFVAVELPSEVRNDLQRVVDELRAQVRGPFRWVKVSGIHLTLKFLGAVPASRTAEIGDVLEGVVVGEQLFMLELSEASVFPEHGSPRVVWIGLAGDVQALTGVQKRVESAMGALGFPEERRQFTPHLTLARVRNPLGRSETERLAEVLASVRGQEGRGREGFQVGSISLMQSTLMPSGAVHRQLGEAPFRGAV